MANSKAFDFEKVKLRTPFRWLLIGASQSGKSEFVFDLLSNAEKILDKVPKRVIYCYGVFQERFREFAQDSKIDIEFREGFDPNLLPTLEKESNADNIIVIVDDLMLQDIWKDLALIFTQGRHANLSIMLLMQNPFFRGHKSAALYGTTITRNASGIVLFRTLADRQAALILGKKVID